MPQIKIEIYLTDSTTEIKLNKPEKLIEIFPEFAQSEEEKPKYSAFAAHFLDTLRKMNEMIK